MDCNYRRVLDPVILILFVLGLAVPALARKQTPPAPTTFLWFRVHANPGGCL